MAHKESVCKLILLGNGSVGKSSICARFVDDGFQRVYKQTVGLDWYEKRLQLRGDKSTILQVWDIGGQSVGSKMLGQYIWGSHVIFLCYDVTDAQSFSDLEDWLSKVRRTFAVQAPGPRPVQPQLYVVGNKIDLIRHRCIDERQHNRFIEENGLDGGFFLSAQNGDNVLTAFYKSAARVNGIELTPHELAFTERVVGVTVHAGDDEERTAMADEIEAEDRRLEEMKRQNMQPKGCGCVVQ